MSQDEVLHYLYDIAQCSIGSRLKEVKYPLGATQSLAGPGVRESEAIGASLAFGHALVFEDWAAVVSVILMLRLSKPVMMVVRGS